MSLSEKISRLTNRIYYEWKGVGVTKYLTFLVCYIVAPVTIAVLCSVDTANYRCDIAWGQIMIFYPIMSTWWGILVMKISVGDNYELARMHDRNKWVDIIVFYLGFLLMILPVCFWMLNTWPDWVYPEDFLDLFSQSFLSNGLSYLVFGVTRSVTASFVGVLVLNLFLDGRIRNILEMLGLELDTLMAPLPFVVLGIVMMIVGSECERRQR